MDRARGRRAGRHVPVEGEDGGVEQGSEGGVEQGLAIHGEGEREEDVGEGDGEGEVGCEDGQWIGGWERWMCRPAKRRHWRDRRIEQGIEEVAEHVVGGDDGVQEGEERDVQDRQRDGEGDDGDEEEGVGIVELGSSEKFQQGRHRECEWGMEELRIRGGIDRARGRERGKLQQDISRPGRWIRG